MIIVQPHVHFEIGLNFKDQGPVSQSTISVLVFLFHKADSVLTRVIS